MTQRDSSDRDSTASVDVPLTDPNAGADADARLIRTAADQVPPPPRIPDYDLVRPLGKGAFGEVWLARSRTGLHRAAKIIPKGRISVAEFEGIRAYERHVQDHSHLVDIKHTGETAECFYYVMELADGYDGAATFDPFDYEPRTLASDLRRFGTLEITEAVRVGCDVLAGLEHLHELDLLHRDVKPDNILFAGGVAKLADPGLVTCQQEPRVSGCTPCYAPPPPEGVQDRTGDLFCLGRTLYKAVAGQSPERFPERVEDTLLVSRDSRALVAVLTKACAAKREDRFQTAGAFRTALQSIARRGRRLAALGVAAVVIAALALTVCFALRPSAHLGSGRLTLFYGRSCDDDLVTLDASAIPLRSGECIQLQADLDQPGYPFVALVTPNDQRVLHPTGNAGDKQPGAARVSRLILPSQTDGYKLREPDEPMTFILLAATKPIGEPEELLRRLTGLGEVPLVGPNEMLLLEAGQPVALRGSGPRTRGVDVDHPVPIRNGLLQRLHESFQAEFPVIYAITVPQYTPETPAAGG